MPGRRPPAKSVITRALACRDVIIEGMTPFEVVCKYDISRKELKSWLITARARQKRAAKGAQIDWIPY